MKTSRNDPCPCGSEKKYKACCMGRDQARAHARSIIGEEAFDQAEAAWMAAAREEKSWAVDLAPAPAGFGEEHDTGASLVMVMAGEWIAHAEVLSHRPAGAAERARDMAAAVVAAGRALGVLPERLAVPDAELVEPVSRALDGRGFTVVCEDSEELFQAMGSSLEHMDPSPAAGRMTVALTWRETEASAGELADFHEAAAMFYQAVPWASDETAGPFLLEFGDDQTWAASVMGGMGESFGLVIHSHPTDLASIYTSSDPTLAFAESIGFALTVDFDRKKELTRAMQREIAAAGWPIATPRAYPRLFGMALPGRRIRPDDVRRATLALRAVAVFARGGDPLEETGVEVVPFDPEMEEEENRLDWFHLPDEAAPVGADGPAADPHPHVHVWNVAEQRLQDLAGEEERIHRFAAWLREHGVLEEEAQTDLANAESFSWVVAPLGSPGAVTEFDLRLFLYALYLRRTDPEPHAVRALPRSMRRIVQWLEEREGVGYPFAARVLDELDEIAARAYELDEPLEDTLRLLSHDVYDDLDLRAMIASTDLPGVEGGWPDLMTMEVAQLREELQRRWLTWYDELVKSGVTDYMELEDALTARQREWENTPHPQVGGKTPKQVLMEMIAQE